MTSRKTTDAARDVTVTSPHPSSSSSSSTATGSMLMRRRGLASTSLPPMLRIALAPPIATRDLFTWRQATPTRLTVDTTPAAVHLTTSAGVGNISTAILPPTSQRSSQRSSTEYDRNIINKREKTTATYQSPADYPSDMLTATDLIGN